MTWATLAEVGTITGFTGSASATGPQLASANATVTIYANVTEAASAALGKRDLEWLRQATAWQTIWQRDQAGFEVKSVASSVAADGVRADYAGMQLGTGGEWKHVLAPLAARALKNLSWKASRTLRTPRESVPTGAESVLGFLNDAGDPYLNWTT
jgi:hypothetical protein